MRIELNNKETTVPNSSETALRSSYPKDLHRSCSNRRLLTAGKRPENGGGHVGECGAAVQHCAVALVEQRLQARST